MAALDGAAPPGGLPARSEEWVGPIWVSTVWLGLDHRFGGPGSPIIFETMSFSKHKPPGHEDLTWRYSIEAEARAGHERAVAMYREAIEAVEQAADQPPEEPSADA